MNGADGGAAAREKGAQRPAFRVMELRDGRLEVLDGTDAVGPPAPDAVRWIDLQAPDPAVLELLRARFDFHPLTIEDCTHLDQRPKHEEYRDHLFLVTQGFAPREREPRKIDMKELHTFLGERYLVTVHAGPLGPLDEVWRRAAEEPGLLGRGVGFVYYLVADGLVDGNFPILDRIADDIEELEESVLASPRHEDLQRIFDIKRHLVFMRKVLSPQRDVVGVLARRGSARIEEDTALHLRDVYDHLVRITEAIETNRDLLGNVVDAYYSLVSQRTNDIVKYLTILSAVFLPLSFVVGFFGQNFADLPFAKNWVHSDTLTWAMLITCLALPVGMLAWFRHKNWF